MVGKRIFIIIIKFTAKDDKVLTQVYNILTYGNRNKTVSSTSLLRQPRLCMGFGFADKLMTLRADCMNATQQLSLLNSPI